MTAPKPSTAEPAADTAPSVTRFSTPLLTASAAGSAPRGRECPWKPCGTLDCCEFGPVDCTGRLASVKR